MTRRRNEVADWEDDYAEVDGAFAQLIGVAVGNTRVDEATGRLEVTFENGDQLRVVNDQVEPGLDGCSVFSQTRILVVDSAGRVRS